MADSIHCRRDYDAQRTRWLEEQGFRVVRFWNHELREDTEAVDELIWRRLHDTRLRISPLAPCGRGVRG